MHPPKKVLSVFSLVMINVIAVDSLRTLAISAKLGLPLIFYYVVAAVAFFIPVALVAAELSTSYPESGGIYIWVREAFGKRAGFITIWLQWVYNVVWYPTIMSFIAATMAYLFAPSLSVDKTYLLISSLSLFWLFTFLNCFGMRFSSFISILGALFGTLLPMIVIICLGFMWWLQGRPIALTQTSTWLPNLHSLGNLALFSNILFGLIGVEMSAVHADDVRNPQRDYPRAIFYSLIIILLSLMLSALAIIVVVPSANLNIVSGLIEAFSIFFKAYNADWMVQIIAFLIVIGGLSGVSAWIIGPAKGLLVAAKDGALPPIFSKLNKAKVPAPILIAQAVIFSLLCLLFIVFDDVNAAYWLLSDLCAQMALLVYIFMFISAIKLRYCNLKKSGSYRVPGGNCFFYLVAAIGIACCMVAMISGFIPPASINLGNIYVFEAFLVVGLIIFISFPFFLMKKQYSR